MYLYNGIMKIGKKSKILLNKIKKTIIMITYKSKEREDKKMAAAKGKSGWILVVLILAGLVIGGLLGQLATKVDFLWWLGYSQTFGLTTPLELDLSVIQLTFAISFKISVSSIIGMIIGILIYKMI